jgi:SAM-dependent methyltransferase
MRGRPGRRRTGGRRFRPGGAVAHERSGGRRNGTFDDVTASLVLHYLQDWGPALAELRRVLRPGGRLIVSVDHPYAENLWHREAGLKPDYLATYNYTVE